SKETQLIDAKYAKAAYPAAFREFGIDPTAEPSALLADKIRQSPIATRLTAALDQWLEVDGTEMLLDLIRHIDSDAERTAIRRALALGGKVAVAEQLEELDGRTLFPAFAVFVGGHPQTPARTAARILQAAQGTNPNHFGLAIQTARRLGDGSDASLTYYRI